MTIVSRRQGRMWHLMKQRMRDARRRETQEGERVVRECKATAVEESWSRWNQVKEQARNINQSDWKKPKRGVFTEEREVRQVFANNEAVW